MPFWSIAEWRARIGSSWCALGRPIKTGSPYRGRSENSHTMLTRTLAVAMIIMLMVFVGIHFVLRTLVESGYQLSFQIGCVNFDYNGGLLQNLYLINCGLILTLVLPVIKIVVPLMYQSLPHAVKSLVVEICIRILWYFLFGGCFLTRWLILPIVAPLVVQVLTAVILICLVQFRYLYFAARLIRCLILSVLHMILTSLSALCKPLKKLTLRQVISFAARLIRYLILSVLHMILTSLSALCKPLKKLTMRLVISFALCIILCLFLSVLHNVMILCFLCTITKQLKILTVIYFASHLIRCPILSVLHMLQELLSFICNKLKKSTMRLMKISSVGHVKTRIKYAVKNALVETVSLAVTFSLLMLCGDVELNPGPGRYPDLDYDSVDVEQILDEDDVTDVMEEVLSIKCVYFPLGECLRLGNDDLKAIHKTYPDEPVADQALKEVLRLWLNQKYKIDRFGLPTWRMLVEAVDKKTGGNNHELAKEIALNHQSALTSDNMKEMFDLSFNYRAKWRFIGIELKIDTGTLDAIEANNRNVECCLSELVNKWLLGSNPRPTRRAMVKALESQAAVMSGAAPTSEVHDNTSNSKTMEIYVSYMKSLYKAKAQEPLVSPDQWPPPVTMKVFRLAMIETEQLRMESTQDEYLRQKTIVGKVDNVIEHNVKKIELEDIFRGTAGKTKKVLIDGAPGSGKSTLSLQICYLWSTGKLFQEYKLVILVRFRDPAVQCARSIVDLLPCRDEMMVKGVEKVIRASDGDRVLFVLDGWDELPQSSQGHSVILSLIDRSQLHNCSIIITSRPTSSANLHPRVSSRVEILGFSRDELRRFFTDCLQNNIAAVETLLRKIRQNPAVEGCCFLPVNASVVVHLFKCEENLHFASQYSIFSALVRNCIVRHLRKNRLHDKVPALTSLDNLPELVEGPFKSLCELAYNGIVEDKVTFDVKFSSSFNTLGLLQGVESFAGCGISRSFNFLHLSIQEVLAAFHIATQFEAKKQVTVFKTLFGKARFHSVFGYFAAKTQLQTPGINDVIMKIVGKCTVSSCSRKDEVDLLSLLRCLFEAQDPSLCQLVVDQRVKHTLSFSNFLRYITGNLPEHISELKLSSTSLNPLDCLAIGYFLTSIRTILDVDLYRCSIGPEECKALFRADGQVYHIRKLYLWKNSIGTEGAVALSAAMKTMTTLQELDLGSNLVGTEGAMALSEAMKTMTNLQKLYLWYNSIGTEGAFAISKAMKTMTNLQTLFLSDNAIGDDGAVAISEAIKTMSNFKILYIRNNPIGEVGKQALRAAAKQNGTYLSLEW